MKVAVRYARHAGIAALFVAAALLGTLSGVLFAYSDDLPEVSALDNYSPNTITRVLGKDGQLVGEFAVERRVVIHYNDIPREPAPGDPRRRGRRLLRALRLQHLAHGAGADARRRIARPSRPAAAPSRSS